MRPYKFNIMKSTDDQFYFTITAGNGEIVSTSETYHNLKDCKDTIESIKVNASKAITHTHIK
jgi:uncharacterized protein